MRVVRLQPGTRRTAPAYHFTRMHSLIHLHTSVLYNDSVAPKQAGLWPAAAWSSPAG